MQDDRIYGDGVNIAARLEGLAEPGGICSSREVQAQTRGKLELDYEDLGEREVKNIPEPVRVFRVCTESAPLKQTGSSRRTVGWGAEGPGRFDAWRHGIQRCPLRAMSPPAGDRGEMGK